jgi:hypothetical protein
MPACRNEKDALSIRKYYRAAMTKAAFAKKLKEEAGLATFAQGENPHGR